MEKAPHKKARAITGWILGILVILFLLFDAVGKLIRPEAVVNGTTGLGYLEAILFPIGMVLVCTILYGIQKTFNRQKN